ncbi:Probable lipoprotein LppI [Mycobacteroides abscessus]|nr:Probable lipoprotein LppI [Mycobacteroides abscessus]CPX34592.1 Probable lipoprotein LppI [Mycobacteroides abscessus]CPZ48963.1 Probable lipoprotein LppI [Mycobacteroides abscessus]
MMRLLAIVSMFSVLAGCTGTPPQHVPETRSAIATSSTAPSTTTTAASTTPPTTAGGPPPGAAAPVAAVIAWIEAAAPADPANFRTVEEDGIVTQLDGDSVAFRLPGDLPARALTGCVSYRWSEPRFSCLGGVSNPPPKPPGIQGQWIGSWVDFDGKTVDIGSLHGDPGPFNNGNGKPLDYGTRIKFSDYQCRSDPSGMYCVNYPNHSAIRLWGREFVTYGCVKLAKPQHGIGEQFTCTQH